MSVNYECFVDVEARENGPVLAIRFCVTIITLNHGLVYLAVCTHPPPGRCGTLRAIHLRSEFFIIFAGSYYTRSPAKVLKFGCFVLT